MDKQTSTKTPTTVNGRVAIWSPGEYRSMSGHAFRFTESDLKATAQAYSPAAFRAPLVVGHPSTDAPAHGWADHLEYSDGYLWADASKIDPQFAEQVRAGRYRKISPKFYLPGDPQNPVPGTYYLKHVGFLGAAAPANPNLPEPSFSEEPGTVAFAEGPDLPTPEFSAIKRSAWHAVADFMRNWRDSLIDSNGLEAADRALPTYLIDTVSEAAVQPEADPHPSEFSAPFSAPVTQTSTPEGEMTPEELAAEREAIARARQSLEAQRAQMNAEMQKQRGDQNAAFAEALAAEGRITPAQKEIVAGILNVIPAEAQCAFSDGSTAPVASGARAFFQNLPVQIEYSEIGAGDPPATAPAAAFALAPGDQVDRAALALDAKATAYQRANPGVDYVDAVRAVEGAV